ncbi:cache domain-containing protein [Marinomonas sp. 2405UD66-6]|uniref:cache domain-containing protein n=1 Tax=Marinomonas sp. 2405UD66-6 TaxID=3391834 RepID=UPI0039C8D0B9
MGLKSKIILLAVAPLILATAIIIYLSLQSAQELAAEELAIYEYNLVNAKEKALKNHVNIALSAITSVLENDQMDDATAQEEVKRILENLRYDEDGYFFVYEMSGVNLVHPTIPEFVGKDLWAFQDRSGNYLIQGLINAAQAGGGFHRYVWEKPPLMRLEDKLSYVVAIDRWNWMMGTGLYLDDIYDELAKTEATMNRNIQGSFFVVIVVAVITVLLVILLGVVINLHEHKLADTRLNAVAQRFMRLQVNERRGFSRELHDGINQSLVSCKFRIELAGNKLRRNDSHEIVQEELLKASDLISQTINEVRQISHNLRPTLLDDLGLDTAIRSLIDQFSERTEIDVDYRFEVTREMSDEVEISIYRLTQEALTNIEKHAEASSVRLVLRQKSQKIEFECRDNGKGISDNPEPGIGFINMRERLELIGGDFHIASQKGQGTWVYAAFPV